MDQRRDLSDALLTLLRSDTAAELSYARPPERVRGGHSAELYTFELLDAPAELSGPLVIRLPGGDEQATRRERVIQGTVAAAGYPAPTVKLHGDGTSALGRPFTIMDRVVGKTPMAAAGVTGIPKLFREIPGLLARLMADLHTIPAPAVGAVDSGIDALLEGIDDRELRAWFAARRPPGTTDVICHGDLHGENVLVAKGDVVAVLDWELAGIAPAEVDVARTALVLELLPGVPRVVRRLMRRAARRTARAFVTEYARQRPLDRTALAWCDALHSARLVDVSRRRDEVAAQWRPVARQLRARVDAYRVTST